jgi:hypothetical protein
MSLTLLFGIIILQAYLTMCHQQRRLVFEMCRHGARSPTLLDANNIDVFGNQWTGSNELTVVGSRQNFLTGYKNRQKLGDFLSVQYNPSEIFAISTNTSRTIESADNQLQGIFPPGTRIKLNDKQLNHALPPGKFNFLEEIEELESYALPANIQEVHVTVFSPHQFYILNQCVPSSVLTNANSQLPQVQDFITKFVQKYGERILKIIIWKDNLIISIHILMFIIYLTLTLQPIQMPDL